MSQKNVYIDFEEPVSQKEFDLFKETLCLYDLEFFGVNNLENINGTVQSTGMFQLVKGPLIKALDQSGLSERVKVIIIT